MTERFAKMRTIFCIIFTLLYGASSKTINVATNGKVTLQPHVEGEIENIVWMHDGDKMVDWDNKAVNVREYLKFKGRIKLDVKTGDATIINLAKDDSGLYEAVVIIQGRIISIKHRVKVTDPVTKAKVTCPSNATLHCEAEGDSLDYSWSGPGLKTAEMRGQTGPQISKENQDSVYTCVVSNPVSDSSVTYHASDCFTSGDHQLILGVVCAVAVIGVIGAAAGLVYYCYKINSRGQRHTGNEIKHETDGKIITNQKKEESVLLLTGKHQASSCAVTQNTCDQSLNSIEPTGKRLEESVNVGDNSSGKSIITGSQATHTAATNTCDGSSDAEDRVTGDVQEDKMDTTVRLSNDDVTNIPTQEGQKERIGEGGSLDGQSTNSVQDEPAVHDGMKQHEEVNNNPTAVKSYLRGVLLNIFDTSITMNPKACNLIKNDPGPFTQLDSAPRSDESAKPSPTVVTCPHADSSSGSPRQSRYTDAVRDANKCSGNMNMEGTCEYERGTNTVTEEQNQTADPSLSGSAGSIRNDDIINTLPHGGQEEGMQVDDTHFKSE
ncbi:uncharacterized protein LOC116221577 [Clupea harengus]|uniref:Uncharacterized protein LOC116221577 n=1 Tax=Clupea harengus TaxID=7950 RepID=A0A6P8FQJ1_CLUHA|nr:uncharacterized protein LOC116221577 [Clupea harengus]